MLKFDLIDSKYFFPIVEADAVVSGLDAHRIRYTHGGLNVDYFLPPDASLKKNIFVLLEHKRLSEIGILKKQAELLSYFKTNPNEPTRVAYEKFMKSVIKISIEILRIAHKLYWRLKDPSIVYDVAANPYVRSNLSLDECFKEGIDTGLILFRNENVVNDIQYSNDILNYKANVSVNNSIRNKQRTMGLQYDNKSVSSKKTKKSK